MIAIIRKTSGYGWIVRIDGQDIFQGSKQKHCVRYCEARGISFVVNK